MLWKLCKETEKPLTSHLQEQYRINKTEERFTKCHLSWFAVLCPLVSYMTFLHLAISLYEMIIRTRYQHENVLRVHPMPAMCFTQYLINPKCFYNSCVFDSLPYHLGCLTSSSEGYLVPTVDIYSSVDSAVAIWQAGFGSASKWACLGVGIHSICLWEKSSPWPLARALLINSPRNGDTAETHHLWKQAEESFALCFISLEPKHSTTWIDVQLLGSNGFPSRGPAGTAAIGPGGERSLLLKDSHREGNSYLKRFM